MSLTNQPIPSMYNGVSQQPASIRAASQCELQENAYSSISTGVRKRPPMNHVARLSVTSSSTALIHYINRSDTERYVVRLRSGSIEVWDLFTGAAKTVNTPNGTTYLNCSTPLTQLVAVTVSDYTFIVNKTVVTAMAADRTGRAVTPVAISSITRSGSTATMTTGTAHGLAVGDFVNVAGAAQAEYNSWHQVLTVPTGTTLTFAVTGTPVTPASGTLTYTATRTALDGTKQIFSSLPATSTDGFVWRVEGTPDSTFDDYYVRWNNAAAVYIETTKPGEQYKFDPATMPYVLIRNSDGTFNFQQATWNDRLVGSIDSNPNPSFIGHTINDAMFHRNRLGFLSKDAGVLARSGQPFNFFAETSTAVLDSDPIDISTGRAGDLRSSQSFNKTLIAFSDQAQFQLSGGDVLSPKTARWDLVTEFESNVYVRPAGAGHTLFFSVSKSGFSGMREYFVDEDSVTNDAADITAHVPKYIKGTAFRIATSTTEDVMFALTDNLLNEVYVYKSYWGEQKKLQSSWSKFVFEPTARVIGVVVINSTVYFAVDRTTGLFLETMDLRDGITTGNLPFDVLLDRRVALTGAYDSVNGWTTWTLPYTNDDPTNAPQVVLGDSFGANSGNRLTTTTPSATTVRATGDYSAGVAYVGKPYTMRYRFSRFYLKDGNQQTVPSAKLALRTLTMLFEQTGYFRVEVTPSGNRGTYVNTFSGKVLGSTSTTLGKPSISDGDYRCPIGTDSEGCTIDLVNDTHLPSSFLSGQWEAMVTDRSRRGSP